MPKGAPLSENALARIVEEAAAICAVPAPTFAESERAALVQDLLVSAGLAAQIDAAGNVVARVGGDGPALALVAHLDTVFPDLMTVSIVRDGVRLTGPGIGDNALGIAAMLYVARALAQTPPSRPVLFAATVGEEGLGDLSGVTALLDSEQIRALIAVEGHGIDCLAVGGIASIRLRAEFSGPGGHSWSDRGRGSAIHALIGAGERALAAAAPAAFNIGVIEGGTTVNAIAQSATMVIDIRHGDPRVVSAAHARVERTLATGLPDGVSVKITVVGNRPGGSNRPNDPLLEAARAARTAVGLGPAEEIFASTDANAAFARDIPAVGIGITRGDFAHREDEWIAVPPIALGVASLLELVRRLDERRHQSTTRAPSRL